MPSQSHIPVRSALSNYVTAIWESNMQGISHELFFPECVVEIVYNLSGPIHGILPDTDSVIEAPRAFLQGCYSDVVKIHYGTSQHLFGIRLHHYMVQPLLGLLPSECKNKVIDLSLIRPQINNLWYQLIEARDFQERVQIIEQEFPVITADICPRTRYFCDLFCSPETSPVESIDELSKQVCYSPRQLSRKANSMFGVSTEELVIQKKYRTAVQLIHGSKRSLTEIAYSAGFYDQAHFCRTFKHFTGFTAKQYQLQKSEVPFHIFS